MSPLRGLALRNSPAVTLGTSEKCGNSEAWRGRRWNWKNPCFKNKANMVTNEINNDLALQKESNKKSASWADRVEDSIRSSQNNTAILSPGEQQKVPNTARFFIMKTAETFSKVSPFLIEKAITGSVGSVKTIRKMRSGDLFLEVASSQQASALVNLHRLATFDITVVPHTTLNFSRGVVSAADLFNVSTEEILDNMKDQKVCGVRRITIRRDGKVLDTKHLILTFETPDLPQSVKAAYLHLPVRPYIPNPLRCFQCQRYGHSKIACRGKPTCARCGEVGHENAECKSPEKCVNCKGQHTSYSRSCPTWNLEKEITTLKIKNKISYPEARRLVSARTPVSGLSYAAATKKSFRNASTQYCPQNEETPSNSLPLTVAPKNQKVSNSPNSPSILKKTIAINTGKTVSNATKKEHTKDITPAFKRLKIRKSRMKENEILKANRRSNLSKKPHQISENDLVDLHPSDDDEFLMEDISGQSNPSSFKGASAPN